MALTQLTVQDYVLTPLGIRQVGEILKSKKGKIKKKYRWNPDVKSTNRCRMSVSKITTKYGYEAHVTHNEEGKTVTFDRVMPTKTNEERFHIQYVNGCYLVVPAYYLVIPSCKDGECHEGKYYSNFDDAALFIFRNGTAQDIIRFLSVPEFSTFYRNAETAKYHCLALALHFGICASVEILNEDNDGVHYQIIVHNKKMYNKIIVNQEPFNEDFAKTGKKWVANHSFEKHGYTLAWVYDLPDYRSVFHHATFGE